MTRGSDVVKALAFGAKGVMIGRAPLWGTAVAGQQGASLALDIFRTEILRVMAYLGCRSVDEINRDVVYHGAALDEEL
jgi:isopentenyl diphosphate isomerase/L-lactate dehydrogenase-like FMN-dependent dehydrogenase